MAKVFTITEGLENMGAMKSGGQGSVYKGRRVGEIITAIKLLPTPVYSETAEDKNFVAFQNEVNKLRRVNEEPNPNVVKILGSGITDSGNFPFIEMEYIEGPDLEELLKPPHNSIFTVKETLCVAQHLSAALAHCHKAEVRHGDIKSNNVKFNNNTGNYILLDFGLAVMSDEQRRTSLRHAGAIEFMAPEQNEGKMLFETDVYSFGVIIFELLAGRVPFPLNDQTETGRNQVMVAHLETPPPDIMMLRRTSLPAQWSREQAEQEMKVPAWLLAMVYRCLQKQPQDRFANGMQLHNYVVEHMTQSGTQTTIANEQVVLLEEEIRRLKAEKQQLQQQVLQLQQAERNQHFQAPLHRQPEPAKKKPRSKWLPLGISAVILAIIAIFAIRQFGGSVARKPIGEYYVKGARAYFYNKPDESTRRNAYAVHNNQSIPAYDQTANFIYTEITNEKGQTSKGWLRKQDLTAAGAQGIKANPAIQVSSAIDQQLQAARQFLADQKPVEALTIYSQLANQQVAEAMYQYAKLALQNKNGNLSCADAFAMLKQAAAKGYPPAKRSLGFLYVFADNKDKLKQSLYLEHCVYGKNFAAGSRLLMEAMLSGDSAAAQIVNELTASR